MCALLVWVPVYLYCPLLGSQNHFLLNEKSLLMAQAFSDNERLNMALSYTHCTYSRSWFILCKPVVWSTCKANYVLEIHPRSLVSESVIGLRNFAVFITFLTSLTGFSAMVWSVHILNNLSGALGSPTFGYKIHLNHTSKCYLMRGRGKVTGLPKSFLFYLKIVHFFGYLSVMQGLKLTVPGAAEAYGLQAQYNTFSEMCYYILCLHFFWLDIYSALYVIWRPFCNL